MAKSCYHPTYNAFGVYQATDGFWYESVLLNSVADCFKAANVSTTVGRPDSKTELTVYKDQFTYVPEYANKKSIQEEARQSIDLLSADEGVEGLVGVANLHVTTTTNGAGLYSGSTYLFNSTEIPNEELFVNNDEFTSKLYNLTKGGVWLTAGISDGGDTVYIVDAVTGLAGDYTLAFDVGDSIAIVLTTELPHLSQGSRLLTDRIGNPTNWEQVALDRLAEGKPLIGQNALLVNQDGTSYAINNIMSSKVVSNFNAIYTNDGTATDITWLLTTGSVPNLITNAIDWALDTNLTRMALQNYTANNNPAIKSTPLPMLTVDSKVTMSSSHSLYKGAAVGNMNGKIQVGNEARGYESKVLENAYHIPHDYIANVTESLYANIRIFASAGTGGELGFVYEYKGLNFISIDFSTLDWSHIDWVKQIPLPEHRSSTLTASTSPANKWFTGYAYDENGAESAVYVIQEMKDAGLGVFNSTEFDNLTNGTTLDDAGNTVNTSYHSVLTGFKKGDR